MSDSLHNILTQCKRDLLPRKNHHKILWYADATNDNDIEDTLFRVFDLMAFRFEHKREQHKSKLDEPVLFVIIEEPSVILKGSHKQQYRFILDRLSSIGRGVEIYLIMFVNSEKNILPTTIMDNMVNKVCFSQCDHKQYKKLFGYSLDRLEPESAYVLTPNFSKPKRTMSIYVWDTVCGIE